MSNGTRLRGQLGIIKLAFTGATLLGLLHCASCTQAPAEKPPAPPVRTVATIPDVLPELKENGNVEIQSAYSHIRLERLGTMIILYFIRDTGEAVVESRMDVTRPQDLLVPYTQFMFASYLFKPEQEKVLIVGLGGGSMVHFLKHFDPKLKVDVVEIDPDVVRIADHYFGVKAGGNVRITCADGLEYLRKTPETYDVIYMDAFLKPSQTTDSTGVPLTLKTQQFLADIQQKLTPNGIVVFNLNSHGELAEDIASIRKAFATSVFFAPPSSGNLVAVAMRSPTSWTKEQLEVVGRRIDAERKPTHLFTNMLQSLVQPPGR